jgi:hypothetical protein
MQYFDLILGILAWTTVFILVKPRRLKQLWPVGLVSLAALFGTELFFMALQMYGYENPLLPILGVPLGYLLFAGAGGIIALHFMPEAFGRKIVLITIFAFLLRWTDFLALRYGTHVHDTKFTAYHNFFQNFVIIALVVFISEGLFQTRIHNRR